MQHHTSSLHYPQSNGLAEAMVKTFRKLIENAILQRKLWFELLQEYRLVPISGTIPSPAEILFHRRCRSNLSILPSQLIDDRIGYVHEETAKKECRILKEETNSTKEMKLKPGQAIMHKDPKIKNWNSDFACEKLHEPHFYNQIVSSAEGTEISFNPDKFLILFVRMKMKILQDGLVMWSSLQRPVPVVQPHNKSASTDTIPALPSTAKKTNFTLGRIGATMESTQVSTRNTKGITPRHLIEEK